MIISGERYKDAEAYLDSLVWTPVATDDFSTLSDQNQLHRIRHSCSHLMAAAVREVWPDAEFAVGPATASGFFYDIKLGDGTSQEVLEDIEQRMAKMVDDRLPFAHASIPKEAARTLFAAMNQSFKLQILDGIESEDVDLYRVGTFVDLCAGPHVPDAAYCKHFKILTSSSAHWRDEQIPSLTRLSGTAWTNPKDLRLHLNFVDEARKRDHRRLGAELELFNFHEWAASALWQPKGLHIRRKLEELWRETIANWDYEEILNPLLYRKDLYECSGHWDHFQSDMFVFRDEQNEPTFALKPMNCPDTMLYFKTRSRSYRELPLRVAEGQILHRNERTGSLMGIMRGRNFVQDDAHIFLTGPQISAEIQGLMDMLDFIYGIFDLDYSVALSTRPERFMGDPETWDQAEENLKAALDERGKPYVVDEGEGAFYGPKIDITIRDSLGRNWQCGTFQLDFQLPQRFDLTFDAEDGSRQRPIVIHRAIFGSFERFIGIIIEHLNGKFPTWLAPIQAVVLPVSESATVYATDVVNRLKQAGCLAKVAADESLNYRIRHFLNMRVPNILVVGEREMENQTVSLRRGKRSKVIDVSTFVDDIQHRIAERTLDVEVTPLQQPGATTEPSDRPEGTYTY